MTAPNGPILFNNSTGSDTTASGLGAANVYGTGASTTGASAVVTGITTTGVTAGDLLWVQSSSGRQFSIIATVDSSTQVTCDDVFANTESGRTWAIGGKRATFQNSLRIFYDLSAGWIVESETDQTFSSRIDGTGRGTGENPAIIEGNGNTITYTGTIDYCIFLRDFANWQNWRFTTTTSPTVPRGLLSQGNTSGTAVVLKNCIVDGFYWNLESWGGSYTNLERCSFLNAVDHGIRWYYGNNITIKNCYSANNGGDGFFNQSSTCKIIDSVFHNNGSNGANIQSGLSAISGNVFSGNGSDGISCASRIYLMSNNIFSGNGGYGLNSSTSKSFYFGFGSNAYYSNVSGSVNDSFFSDATDITLTADPFVSAANGNFNLNDFPGGGNLLRAKYYELGG